ncbi:MAG: 4Fe-4S binding protein [Euryarchaeota archaeon]|nr:4Fe-4S binding protein [Euryarchaeota archaeon]
MVKVTINEDLCKGCGMCADVCTTEVLEKQSDFKPTKVIKEENCIECLSCLEICPAYAIEHEDLTPTRRFHIETKVIEMTKKIV